MFSCQPHVNMLLSPTPTPTDYFCHSNRGVTVTSSLQNVKLSEPTRQNHRSHLTLDFTSNSSYKASRSKDATCFSGGTQTIRRVFQNYSSHPQWNVLQCQRKTNTGDVGMCVGHQSPVSSEEAVNVWGVLVYRLW